ncbi:MAG: hypothetical protein LBF60_09590 [Treponema sp.]|nr:hypothetical protein [Treponema sp.]
MDAMKMDAMKRKTADFVGVLGVRIAFFAAFMAVCSCASSGGNAGGAASLDGAIRASVERLGATLRERRWPPPPSAPRRGPSRNTSLRSFP